MPTIVENYARSHHLDQIKKKKKKVVALHHRHHGMKKKLPQKF